MLPSQSITAATRGMVREASWKQSQMSTESRIGRFTCVSRAPMPKP